ncbi:3-hydroxyisobutyrate dehydrogenase-related protein [Skeletonema marinoi]|uniref:3-hydroxyisobutyrate dehydrogenase-related protein n=1 Tax=Skeletonema marinoi TaxID=267567 RepID=A0AAD9DDK0_9STRA|nr:3-hydroxyisobutyrate dehydrogenase-related protein [Skeletonema marinoi]
MPTSAKSENLKASHPDKSIEIKTSAKDVVSSCDIVFSMLSTPEASAAVFDDAANGTLAGVSSSSVIIDCATLAESDMKRMSDQVTAKGGTFLEAPVSGSKGSQAVFDDATVQAALDAMGKASHYFGEEVGKATRAKLVVNSLMGTMMAAFGESLALAESLDLDGSKMLEVISQGAIASPMFALKGPKMLKKDHAPNFPLCHAHKDMKLAVDAAKSVGTEYSVTQMAEETFRKAREDEELKVANEDFSAVFEKIHKESKSDYSKKRKLG